MMRCMQIGQEVLVMTGKESDGKISLGEMRIVPLVVYHNIEKGFRYDKVLQP